MSNVKMGRAGRSLEQSSVPPEFSGGSTPGERVKDMAEVASQALRSARWVGKFSPLCQHIKGREDALRSTTRPTRFLKGSEAELNKLVKLHRVKPLNIDILIVQPGLQKAGSTQAQATVLAAALTYVKETVDIDIGIACSA